MTTSKPGESNFKLECDIESHFIVSQISCGMQVYYLKKIENKISLPYKTDNEQPEMYEGKEGAL